MTPAIADLLITYGNDLDLTITFPFDLTNTSNWTGIFKYNLRETFIPLTFTVNVIDAVNGQVQVYAPKENIAKICNYSVLDKTVNSYNGFYGISYLDNLSNETIVIRSGQVLWTYTVFATF